jgi:ABC-2 type transport system ATP-binding protein
VTGPPDRRDRRRRRRSPNRIIVEPDPNLMRKAPPRSEPDTSAAPGSGAESPEESAAATGEFPAIKPEAAKSKAALAQAPKAAPPAEAPPAKAPISEAPAPAATAAPVPETAAPAATAEPAPDDYAPAGVSSSVPPLELKGLTHRWGEVTALDGVSFIVPRGAICGLIGPDGSGKTTLMRIVATLVAQTGGTASVEGHDTSDERQAVRQQIGYVPSAPGLYEEMRVGEYLNYFAAIYGLSSRRRASRIDGLLALMHLNEAAGEHVDGLSESMRLRLSVARALIHNPSLLLLDEPSAGLDPRSRVDLRDLLSGLKAQGITTLVSSHVMSDLSDVCTHVVTLERGRVTAAGRLDELLSAAKNVSRVKLTVLADEAVTRELLETVEAVISVSGHGGRFDLGFAGDDAQASALLARLIAAGIPVAEFTPVHGKAGHR